jgi:hypothetical protein
MPRSPGALAIPGISSTTGARNRFTGSAMILAMADVNPIIQALIAGIFTWFLTAIGAGAVCVTRRVNRKSPNSSQIMVIS